MVKVEVSTQTIGVICAEMKAALPALLVMLGAGAALAGLVRVFPQIVWLTEHKALLLLALGAWFAFVQPLLEA